MITMALRAGVALLAFIGLQQTSARASENFVATSSFTCTAGATTVSGASPCALADVSSSYNFAASVIGNTATYSLNLNVGDNISLQNNPYPESVSGTYGDAYYFPDFMLDTRNIYDINLSLEVYPKQEGGGSGLGAFVTEDLTVNLGGVTTYDITYANYPGCYGYSDCHLSLTTPADFSYIYVTANASVGVNAPGYYSDVYEEATITISQFAPDGVTPVSFVPEPTTAWLVAPFVLISVGWSYRFLRTRRS